MSALEARNVPFIYHDAFLVEVGEGKRHVRASLSDLKELLLPKKNDLSQKDQVAHWYEAQLIHYGLPKTKDKNTAKVRLTSAISAGNLSVPENIKQIEADLKKEYTSMQRKVKREAQKDDKKNIEVTSVGGKRKIGNVATTSRSSPATKTSIKTGDVTLKVDLQTDKGKQKSTTKQKVTPRGKRETSTSGTATKTTAPNRVQKIRNHPLPKQTARRSKPFGLSGRQLTSLRDCTSTSSFIGDAEEAPPPYTLNASDHDDEGDGRVWHGPVQISGIYSLNVPSRGDLDELSLRLILPDNRAWGQFSIGHKSGLFRLDNIDGIGQCERKFLRWRSEDTITGELRFEATNDGWIEFDGHGGVRGMFQRLMGFMNVDFEGHLTGDFSHEDEQERVAMAEEYFEEWRAFADRAYGRM